MKCVAIDDEAPALYLLEDNIRRVPFLKLVKSCSNAYEAIEVLQQEEVDLIFLDIEMPELNGVDFLHALPVKPMVIFTTAYEKYAMDGYNLDVLDYLLKPIPFDRFLKAVNKANEYFQLKGKERKPSERSTHIFVYAEYNLIKVVLDDITHIEAWKDYVRIFVRSSQWPIVTKSSMKAIEDKLPTRAFFRIHKSYIIALDKIVSIRKNVVKVGQHDLPVSENCREEFFQRIDISNLL